MAIWRTTTTGCWARYFLGLSFSFSILGAADAPDFLAYRNSPTASAKDEITAYAKTHAKEQAGALAHFTLGIVAYNQKNYTEAQEYLRAAQPLLPSLNDYTSFYIASAISQFHDDAAVASTLAAVQTISTPLRPQATLLRAKASIGLKNYQEAITILRERFDSLQQPDAAEALAQAYQGQQELAQAAALYQRVYFTFPGHPLSTEAAEAIESLKKSLGKGYPPPVPQQMLKRGDYWMARKQYPKAKQEYHDLLSQLSGLEREQATVRAAACDLLAGHAAASQYLKEIRLDRSEAAAERDYYLGEGSLPELEKRYPASPWLLKALVDAGNGYLKEHQTAKAMPLFRLAAAKFPPDAVTALCHWRVAWQAYLDGTADAGALLKEQVSKYPDDQHAATALYFLGRLAEETGDAASARAYYDRAQAMFPHYYYGILAAGRLAEPALAGAVPSAETARMLDHVKFPERRPIQEETPTAATLVHAERAKLLIAAGFPDWAETEVRYGAATDGQRHVLAMELAKSDPTLAQSLRHMKVFTPEYLTLDFDRIPKEIWGYLFPLPLREDLAKAAQERNLDPYLMAGLIRQESEFNPTVVSRANAWGLMQLLPSTGRQLALRDGLTPFDSSMLFDPRVNLKLGAAYLRSQLDRWNGSLEQTLAAYNAGPARVQQWIAGTHFREPAEFVESIPFNETREYVQAVIRNATVYRQLYSGKTPPPQPANALTSSHVSAPTAPKRPVPRKRAG